MDFLYSASGFGVGLIVGLTGVGGGALMTPLLVLAFGVAPVTAVGTDLLYAAVTKSGGTLVHGLKGSVDWRIVRRMALGSLPAAGATLWALHGLADRPEALARAITPVLGVALILTALTLPFRQHLLRLAGARAAAPHQHRLGSEWATVAVGAVLGGLVTLTSVGAGALGMVALSLLYPRLPAVRLVGADLAHAVPLTLIAGIGHWWLGSVDLALLGKLLVGSLPGIVLGSLLATRAPEGVLRWLLASLLLVVGGKFIT